MRGSRASVGILCALVLAACSRNAEAPPTVALKRPIAPRVDVALQRVARNDYVAPAGRALAIPSTLQPWRVDGGPARVENDQLHIESSGRGRVALAIPGPFDLRKTGSLSLRVHAPAERAIKLSVSPKNVPWVVDTARPFEASVAAEFDNPQWRVLRANLAPESDEPTDVSQLELEFTGELGPELVLDSFVLEPAPAETWKSFLRGASASPCALQIATECRPSIALLPGHLLRGSARVAAANSKLAFGYAALDPFRGKPTKVELRATLRGEHGFERTAELELASTARWRDFECDVDAQPGEQVTLELEVVVHGNGSACIAIANPQVFVPETAPPTVVLITSDTHRGDHLGLAHQGVEVSTPALDALASRGLFFSDCFSTTNITIPSHVAIMTGMHPRDSGLIGNNMTLGAEPTTLAEAFRSAGYETLAVTSINLLSNKIAGVDRGFDRMSWPAASRSSQRAVDIALEWLGEARERPVFLWLHVFDAHAPYEPPKRAAPRDDGAPQDENKPLAVDDDGKARIPSWAGPNCDVTCIRGLYGSEVSFVDEQLARVFAHERVTNAVVAFTGDHGEVLGTHGIYWAHKALYPDTLHVPLILAWPGATAARIEAPVKNIDIGRTLLDLADGVGVAFPGRDLVSAVQAKTLDAEPRFGLEGRAHSASVTWQGWHLLLQLEQMPEHERHENKLLHQVELFELAKDPECEHDLVDEHFDKARELRKHLVRWLAGWRGERFVGAVRQDAETLRQLAVLGYAADSGAALGDKPLFDEHCTCPWCVKFR